MREFLSDKPELFENCLEAMSTEFALAKGTNHAVRL